MSAPLALTGAAQQGVSPIACPKAASQQAVTPVRYKYPNSPRLPMSSFQLVGISPEPFEPLFSLPPEQLATRGIHRVIAQSKPGHPCRVSLVDAEVGEELLLLPYEHQPANSPY